MGPARCHPSCRPTPCRRWTASACSCGSTARCARTAAAPRCSRTLSHCCTISPVSSHCCRGMWCRPEPPRASVCCSPVMNWRWTFPGRCNSRPVLPTTDPGNPRPDRPSKGCLKSWSTPLKRFLLLLAILLALAGLTLHQTQLPLYLWYQWQLAGRELPPQAVDLGRYRVDIDALVLEGVEDDLSALTYNAERDTLFALLNGDPYLLELSLDGEVLRRVHLTGLQDMEGLTHVGGNRCVVVEEQRQRLHLIELPEAATELDLSQAAQLTVAMDEGDNKGFEGLSWDSKRQQLLVV